MNDPGSRCEAEVDFEGASELLHSDVHTRHDSVEHSHLHTSSETQTSIEMSVSDTFYKSK